jgi:hypothetical protein
MTRFSIVCANIGLTGVTGKGEGLGSPFFYTFLSFLKKPAALNAAICLTFEKK